MNKEKFVKDWGNEQSLVLIEVNKNQKAWHLNPHKGGCTFKQEPNTFDWIPCALLPVFAVNMFEDFCEVAIWGATGDRENNHHALTAKQVQNLYKAFVMLNQDNENIQDAAGIFGDFWDNLFDEEFFYF